jgi:hypothetical protein
MILFDKFEDALEEAEVVRQSTYRAIYYIVRLQRRPV